MSFFGASKPVSRVLSFKTAIYLDVPLPTRSSHLPSTAGPAMRAPTVLLRIEFTAMGCSQPSGGLLPPPFHPYLSPRKRSFRGAPKRGEAVSLCCTFPGVAPGGCYPLSLPYGARTFLRTGLSASPRGCPACLLSHFIPSGRQCQIKIVKSIRTLWRKNFHILLRIVQPG